MSRKVTLSMNEPHSADNPKGISLCRKGNIHPMNEQMKYEVIKSLQTDHPVPNKLRAALTLGCTVRQSQSYAERLQGTG